MVSSDIYSFTPPNQTLFTALHGLANAWFRPEITGTEHIQAGKPALLVANHSVMGNFDMTMVLECIYRETGVFPRSLGDHWHYKIPGWRDIVEAIGAVEGTRENCAALMEAGEHILVYPGGAREVMKKRHETYRLVWKERTGFVRMAVQYGYPIIPVACVGGDEAYDILLDSDDYQQSLAGQALDRLGLLDNLLRDRDEIPPLVKGLGPTWLPKRAKFRFVIGEPIETKTWQGQQDDPDLLKDIRSSVAAALSVNISKGRMENSWARTT